MGLGVDQAADLHRLGVARDNTELMLLNPARDVGRYPRIERLIRTFEDVYEIHLFKYDGDLDSFVVLREA